MSPSANTETKHPARPTLRVGGVPEHFNLPWRLAIERGVLDAVANVRYADYPGGTGAMADALARGELDVALMLTEGAVLDIARGGDNRLVKVFVDSPITWGIHTGAASKLEAVDYTKGRRIAISRYGSGSHLIAVVDAVGRGVEPGELEFTVVDNLDGARRALAAGDADLFLWEKHMTQPLVDSGEFRRVGEREVPWPAFVVSVRHDIAESAQEALKAVLNEVYEQAVGLKTHPGAAALIADRYAIAEEDAAQWLERVSWCSSFERPDAALSRVIDALVAQGAVASDNVQVTAIWAGLSG